MGDEPLTVLDTHALFWWYTLPDRLSERARRAIQQSLRQGRIAASTISLLELATAYRRGRLELARSVDSWIEDLLRLSELHLEPVTSSIAQAAGALPDALHGDPADRIIVATAIGLKGRLVTADKRVRESGLIETVW